MPKNNKDEKLRSLPHSLEAEEAVLGCMLINNTTVSKVVQLLNKSSFYSSKNGIIFETDKNLVRGLDYYCHTVFEFKTDFLGAQNTIIGGGRYDGLVKTLGGPNIPGLGWACGIDRLMMMMNEEKAKQAPIKLIIIEEKFKEYGLNLLLKLRKMNFKISYDYKFNIKKSLRQANELNIKFAIIIGENERSKGTYTIKNLNEGNQKEVDFKELSKILNS